MLRADPIWSESFPSAVSASWASRVTSNSTAWPFCTFQETIGPLATGWFTY